MSGTKGESSMKRRDFLTIIPAAAVGGLVSTPVQANETIDMLKSLEIITRTIINDYKEDLIFNTIKTLGVFELTVAMMRRYPKFFHPDFIMDSIVAIINGKVVTAMSRALTTSYDIEFAQELKADVGIHAAKTEIFDTVCEELEKEWNRIEAEGKRICPYIPLDYAHTYHYDSFKPRIGFKTRYGVV